MPDVVIYNLTDHWFPDKIGGSCLYAYKLHQLLSRHVKTETVTLHGESSPCEKNMAVHKVLHKTRFWQNRRALRELSRNTDAIWVVHSPWFFLHLFFALGFAVRNRVVAVYHGPWFREYYASASAKKNPLARIVFSSLRYAIELFYCVYVRRFIFLSKTMYLATSEYLPISEAKVHIVPMWSEKKGWTCPVVEESSHGSFTLSTFRRLEPRMGLQDLIRALHRCDLEDFSLTICGDGPYKSDLSRLVEELRLQQSVRLLGWVSEEEKLEFIKQSDAVIIPSRELEGFSLLALEALENGTPVLLTEAVGFYEYVRDVEQDFVQKINLDDAKVEMRDFLSKRSRRSGLERLEAIFDAEKICGTLLAVLMPDRCQPEEERRS